MKLTEEEALNLHVEMWNEMAENGYQLKSQTSIARKYNIKSDCFLCEYYIRTHTAASCTNCPFAQFYCDYDDDMPCTDGEDSPFAEYECICGEDNIGELKDICIEIAELGL